MTDDEFKASLTDEQLKALDSMLYRAYTAGIFDGEGSVVLTRGATSRFHVTIAQKNQLTYLEELKVRWGGSVIPQYHAGADKWVLVKQEGVEAFLSGILPWLRFKRAKALLALTHVAYAGERGKPLDDKSRLARAFIEKKFDELREAQRGDASGVSVH